ncbi:MAG: PD40 domain-containing protein [Deltaproteobacteria bacterium]|nr:PD40 domain-containing protein [Deltaproteobacteria bacterium]
MSFRASVALFAALLPSVALAAGAYDPSLEYQTLETPRFLVVFAKGYEEIAVRTGKIAETVLPRIEKRLGYEVAGKVSIVLDDQTDFANGSATILPTKTVTLFITPPTEVSGLEEYDDWLESILVHELTHIVHLDSVSGLPWLGRFLFGKYVALNQYTPAWVTEGLAVYSETVDTGAGRGRSSYVDMVLRMAALSDRFPGIDQAFRSYSNWPFSNVAYFVGGRFQLYLAQRFGEDALAHYHHAYAATPVPFVTWLAAKLAFGATLESLWGDFEAETRRGALETLARVGTSSVPLTRPRRLTRVGGDLLGPRITPDGKAIVFSTLSPVDGARVRRIPFEPESTQEPPSEVLLDDTFSKAFSFTNDGKAFYFQQTEINQRYYAHNSILRYDLETEDAARVQVLSDDFERFLAPSGSLRARDPDVSRDGRRLVFVQTPNATNRLVLAFIESDGVTIHPEVIVPAAADVQLSNPRFSPDGKSIAVSRFLRGRRDVVIFDLRGNLVAEVTRDRAQDIDPTYSGDGRWLVFSSDRTGIYNLYAYDLESSKTHQLTNVVGGAYQPSITPDGRHIVFRGYSEDGFDVYTIPFAPGAALEAPAVDTATVGLFDRLRAGLDRTARRPPRLSPDLPAPPPPSLPEGERNRALTELPELFELKSYSSLDTLLPFHDNWNLFPLVATNEREIYGQLSHFGRDPLDQHAYALWATYATESGFVGGGATYANDQLEPTFTLSAGASARTFVLLDRKGEFLDYFDEQSLAASFSIGLPLLARHYMSIGYSFEHRSPFRPPPDTVLERASRIPSDGRFARVSLGYTYNNTRGFARSISPERGYSLGFGLSGLSKGLGSDYEQIVASGEARGYVSLPYSPSWLTNHVLAGRLSLSLGGGPNLGERFRLGGVAGSSILSTTTTNFQPLRGLRTAGLDGTAVLGGTLEYRAPIVWVERGLGTFPAVLRVLHLCLFFDAGRTFEGLDPDQLIHDPLGPLAMSVGAELRATVLLWHNLELDARLGVAQVLKTPNANLDTSGAFFELGSPF